MQVLNKNCYLMQALFRRRGALVFFKPSSSLMEKFEYASDRVSLNNETRRDYVLDTDGCRTKRTYQ